jgi:hypothetical protein
MKSFVRQWAGVVSAVVASMVPGAMEARAQEIVLPTHALPPPDLAAELVMRQPRVGLFEIGPFGVTPRFSTSAYYDDNVSRSEEEDEFVLTFEPGLRADARDVADGLGKSISVDYSAAFQIYTQGRRRDRIKHQALITGSLLYPKLVLGFHQSFAFNTDPDVDVSGRSDRTEYRTGLNSRYALGEKTSIEVNATSEILDYDENFDSWTLENQNWINYAYSPKLGLGLGVTLGYVDVEEHSSQTYEQALGRITYAVAEKLNFAASFGGEVRQYGGGVGDSFSPVWTILGAYRVREGTSFSLQANQQYRSSSRYGNQDYLRTGFSARISQRIYRRAELSVSGLYYHSDYGATERGVSATRKDDSLIVSVGVDTAIGQRWNVGVFYDYQDNSSTEDEFNYDRHRVGVRAAWVY